MAVISTFCFWFSVRLGSIIIGILTLLQASILLTASLIARTSLRLVSEILTNWLNIIKLEGEVFKEIATDPRVFVIALSAYFVCLLFASVLMLFGAFQCKPKFLIPFIILYLVYIFGLATTTVLLLMFVKANGNGLGDLILYSNLSGFILLFYFYTWSCVLSFAQIIAELRRRLGDKLKAVEAVKARRDFKKVVVKKPKSYNYASFN